MSDLPSISGPRAIEVFGMAGFTLDRISKSSHHVLKKDGHMFNLTVPVHGNKPLKRGLLRSLIRDAGLTVPDFVELLRH